MKSQMNLITQKFSPANKDCFCDTRNAETLGSKMEKSLALNPRST